MNGVKVKIFLLKIICGVLILSKTNKGVDFAFREQDITHGSRRVFPWGGPTGRNSDEIIFLTKNPKADTLIASWRVRFNIPAGVNTDTIVPGLGDVLTMGSY